MGGSGVNYQMKATTKVSISLLVIGMALSLLLTVLKSAPATWPLQIIAAGVVVGTSFSSGAFGNWTRYVVGFAMGTGAISAVYAVLKLGL